MTRNDAIDVVMSLLDRARREDNRELAAALEVAREDMQDAKNVAVKCSECGSLTTRLEANTRMSRRGQCANCGGTLHPLPRTGIDLFDENTDDLLQDLHRKDTETGTNTLYLRAAKHIEYLINRQAKTISDIDALQEVEQLLAVSLADIPAKIKEMYAEFQRIHEVADKIEVAHKAEIAEVRRDAAAAMEVYLNAQRNAETELKDTKLALTDMKLAYKELAKQVRNAFVAGYNAHPDGDRIGGWNFDPKDGVTEADIKAAFNVYLKILEWQLEDTINEAKKKTS